MNLADPTVMYSEAFAQWAGFARADYRSPCSLANFVYFFLCPLKWFVPVIWGSPLVVPSPPTYSGVQLALLTSSTGLPVPVPCTTS